MMNEKQIANELISVFSKTKSLKAYFQSDLKWLEERLAIWDKNYIRVGLVGVTSSGKSTLLNAILGEDILPTAVRPSSGTLITCSKGKKIEATVYFENGRSIKLPKENLKEQLRKYGDESYNQENKYKVKIIDVKSPHFLFSESIQIIDSPGLDAHGLERHEQISMELLLPTVDLCMYVVTLKANSDSITHGVLKTIYDHKKPLIIVQNMLDSVEAKLGRGGIILKSRETVSEEHQNRLERILIQVNPELPKMVGIIQLSAKKAVDSRRLQDDKLLAESQINGLVRNMTKQVESLQPKLYLERTTQILRHIIALQNREEKMMVDAVTLEKITKEQEKEIERFKTEEQKVHRKISNRKQELTRKIINLEPLTNHTIHEIKALNRTDMSQCKTLLNKLEATTKEIEENFISSMRELNEEVVKLLESLNLHTKDYENDIHPKSLQTGSHFAVKKTLHQSSYKQKKSGIGNGAKRLFGKIFSNDDWGYETVHDEYEIIDWVAISINLKEYQKNFSNQLKSYIERWEDRSESFLFRAREEIQRRMDDFRDKQDNLLETQEVIDILFILKRYITELKEKNHFDLEDKVTDQKGRPKKAVKEKMKLSISEETFGLYQLSHHLLTIPFKKCIETVQERNMVTVKYMTRTMIWGWDLDSLLQFVERHFNLVINIEEEKQLKLSGLLMIGKVFIIDESKLHQTHGQELKGILQSGQYNVYVLLNLIQIGAAEKALRSSSLLQFPFLEKVTVNCVIQSLNEFKTANNITEGIHILSDKLKELSIFHKGEVLFNDKNPLYSMISLELSNQYTIIADAQEVLRNVKQRFQHYLTSPREEEYIEEFVRALIDTRGRVIK